MWRAFVAGAALPLVVAAPPWVRAAAGTLAAVEVLVVRRPWLAWRKRGAARGAAAARRRGRSTNSSAQQQRQESQPQQQRHRRRFAGGRSEQVRDDEELARELQRLERFGRAIGVGGGLGRRTGRYAAYAAYSGRSEWQIDIDSMSYEELYERFPGNRPTPPLSADEVARIPAAPAEKFGGGSVAGEGDGGARPASTRCAICLRRCRPGQIVRELPGCCHIYHMECIDEWLQVQGSCPVCRTHVVPPERDACDCAYRYTQAHTCAREPSAGAADGPDSGRATAAAVAATSSVPDGALDAANSDSDSDSDTDTDADADADADVQSEAGAEDGAGSVGALREELLVQVGHAAAEAGWASEPASEDGSVREGVADHAVRAGANQPQEGGDGAAEIDHGPEMHSAIAEEAPDEFDVELFTRLLLERIGLELAEDETEEVSDAHASDQ